MTDPMEQLRTAQPMPRGERLATWVEVHGVRVVVRRPWRASWWTLWQDSTLPAHPDAVRRIARPLRLARAVAAHRLDVLRDNWRRCQDAERIAEERKVALFKAWADEQATSALFHERGREIEIIRAESAERLEQARHWREQAKAAEAERDALRRGHTCREGDRVDCPACDATMRRIAAPAREEVADAIHAFEVALDAFDAAWSAYEPTLQANIHDPRGAEVDAANERLDAAREALVALATRGRT